jgi:hypothetical protein
MSFGFDLGGYYPSARLRLIIRLEDYGAPGTPTPPKTPTLNRGAVTATKKLRVVEEGGGFVLLGDGDSPGQKLGPQKQTSSSDGLTFVIDGIIPKNARHDRNGIRIADQLKATMSFLDLPLDPRPIRSCAVEYYLGTVPAGDYALGVAGNIRADATSDGLPLPYNVIPDAFSDKQGNQRSNLRFQGWVDVWRNERPADGGPTVTLECTDNTRILIEQEAPPALTIGVDDRIDKAIATYMSNFPQLRGFSVVYLPAVPPASIPKLKSVLGRNAYPPKLGPTPVGGGGGGASSAQKLSVWDYITDVIGALGHTVRVEGTAIIIQRARTLYAQGYSGRADDTFTGRTLPDGQELRARTYVYGENILQYDMERHFTKAAPFNVEVRSYLGERKKTLVVRYPEKADRQKKLVPGQNGDQKYQVVRVSGIGDMKTLRVLAQSVYETWGRNEISTTLLTKNLGSLGGSNIDPDMLDAIPGDSVDVVTARTKEGIDTNTVMAVADASSTQAQLKALGFRGDFAAAYAEAYAAIGFPHTFRIKTLSTDWDQTKGVNLEATCINYVEVRADAQLPADEEVTAAMSQNSPKPVPVTIEGIIP